MVLAMSEKRTKIAIPPELEAEMTPVVRVFVEVQLARIEPLEAEVAELKRQIGRSPQNSSVPPSNEHPNAKQPKREPTGRNRGEQKEYKKHRRTLVPARTGDLNDHAETAALPALRRDAPRQRSRSAAASGLRIAGDSADHHRIPTGSVLLSRFDLFSVAGVSMSWTNLKVAYSIHCLACQG